MIRLTSAFAISILIFNYLPLTAQSFLPQLKEKTAMLSADSLCGRGYVNGGVEAAAKLIAEQMHRAGLKPFPGHEGYRQAYHLPINIYKEELALTINGRSLRPGKDFMIHPSGCSRVVMTDKIQTIDVAEIQNRKDWKHQKRQWKKDDTYCLKNITALNNFQEYRLRKLSKELKRGVFILPLKEKLSWLASGDQTSATIFYLTDSLMPDIVDNITASVNKTFQPKFPSVNLLGYVPGTAVPDSFIVVTAHYDHLGQMGPSVIFPGASDNASGVAMLLCLAEYYAIHPQRYSIAFIAFSGEEAMLKGSAYYTRHPVFPLRRIKFLLNLDIAGDATNGITVVNADAHPRKVALLDSINALRQYVPAIRKRQQYPNSDHYPFAKKKVPAIYIYTNGSLPYYHDMNDSFDNLTFTNVETFTELIRDYIIEVSKAGS